MMEKDRIIGAALDQSPMLPLVLLDAARVAARQLVYLIDLFRAARAHADREPCERDMRQQRIACGIDDSELDDVIVASSRETTDSYHIPHAERLLATITRNIRVALEPLRETNSREAAQLQERHHRFVLSRLVAQHDWITAESVALVVSRDGDGDSLEQLVSDIGSALDAAYAQFESESIRGARTLDVRAAARPLVEAFMRGVHETHTLKAGSLGLATSAAQTGEGLVICNEIDPAEAHLVVLRISGLAVTLEYFDTHLHRMLFCQRLLERYYMRWDDAVSRRDGGLDDGVYHVIAGRYRARTRRELEDFLRFFGSRLVFLIDWRRARRDLRTLVPKERALQLLEWDAEEQVGHHAFVRCEAASAVRNAIALVLAPAKANGRRGFDEALARDDAVRYLRRVMRVCSERSRQGWSTAQIHEEIKGELFNHLRLEWQQRHTAEMSNIRARLVTSPNDLAS